MGGHTMKQQHVHSWKLTSPHPFVAVLKYGCTSCPAVREQKRETDAERLKRMEDVIENYDGLGVFR